MIVIHDLKKEYKDFSLHCSLEVKKGQITGLIGQNGAGKSTLFKSILGLISLDGGQVCVLGKDTKDFTAKDRERLGVALSDSGFSGYLRVKDLFGILRAMYPSFDGDLFDRQLRRFGIPLDKQIKDFSTGMKAKLKVLVALSHRAELLILDEPTAGLDVVARDELLGLLRAYMEENEERSILISSHISDDLAGLCDDLYMLHQGRIILHEDTDVLLSDYGLIKVDEKEYEILDRAYLLAVTKEPYGYCCLTDQRRFYEENHPRAVIEPGGIDGLITMMIKGGKP